jgi:hypothetical protein
MKRQRSPWDAALTGHCAQCGRVSVTCVCRSCEHGHGPVDPLSLPDRRWRGMVAYERGDHWCEPDGLELLRGGRGIVP